MFKDKKNNKSSSEKNASALISLDLENLGCVETYINKISSDVSIQFRLENEFAENFIKSNLDLLNDYLAAKNLNIKNVQIKKLEEKFSMISNINKTSKPINLSSFNTQA